MNCPKCGKEMEPGWIYGGRGRTPWRQMRWSPKQGKAPLLPGREDVTLVRGGAPAACICKTCRIVILEYEDASPYDQLYQGY